MRIRWWMMVVCAAVSGALWVRPAAAQDLLSLAREQLRSGHTDSALVLLGGLTDSAAPAPPAQAVEAWILTGIARFYQGSDSGAAAAFRRAFILDPSAQAEGLARMDSSLGALFEAQRPAPIASGPPVDSVYDCRPRCPKQLSKPELTYFPQVNPADAPRSGSQIYPGSGGLGPSGVHGAIVYQFILTEAGSVDRGTLRITYSNARPWEQVFSDHLLEARFKPARIGARAVKAWVNLRVEIQVEGMEGFRYVLHGP